MATESSILRRSRLLSEPREGLAKAFRLSQWLVDRYVGVDYFADTEGWCVLESVCSEAAADGGRYGFYQLTLQVNCPSSRQVETDFGAGKLTYSARSGNFIFADARSIHRLCGRGPFHSITLFMECGALDQRLERLSGRQVPIEGLLAGPFRDVRLEGLVLAFLQSWRAHPGVVGQMDREDFKDAICTRLLAALNVKVSELAPGDRILPQNIKKALEYIQANSDRNISRDQLAHVTGVDPHHFTRLFKQTVGSTPKRYLMDLRMERAIDLLRTEDPHVPIEALALSCGFASASHFGLEFKRYTGMTPFGFRQTIHS